MSCTKSYEEGKAHIDHIVSMIEATPRSQRTHFTYLRRNILCYSWLIQKINQVIDRELLENLIGRSLINNVQEYLQELLIGGFAVSQGTGSLNRGYLPRYISFCPNFLEAILHELEKSYGDMEKPQKVFASDMTLVDFLGLFLYPKDIQLVNVLTRSFRSAFASKSIRVMQLSDVDELSGRFDNHDLVNFGRLITLGSWSFILFAYPSNNALSTETLDHIRIFLSDVRMTLFVKNQETYPGIHSLLITTGVDKFQDVLNIPHESRIHYMWAFSSVRLIVFLNKLVSGDYEASESAFQHFFDDQDSIAFSVQEGEKNFASALKKN